MSSLDTLAFAYKYHPACQKPTLKLPDDSAKPDSAKAIVRRQSWKDILGHVGALFIVLVLPHCDACGDALALGPELRLALLREQSLGGGGSVCGQSGLRARAGLGGRSPRQLL